MTPAAPQQPQGKKSSAAVIAIVLVVGGFLLCAVVGILAAIAVPNFIRFQARSKQIECKTNLKSIFTAERAYQAEKDTFSSDLEAIGFSPDTKTRYTYFLGGGTVVPAAHPEARSLTEADLPPLFEPPHATKDAFTAVCAGNLDGDADLDVWSVSSAERTIHGERVEPGRPFQEHDDLR